MGWFINFKIRTKLTLAFLIVALVAFAVGAIGTYNINEMSKENTKMYNNMVVPLQIMNELTNNFQQLRIQMLDINNANNNDKLQDKESKIKSIRDRLYDYKKQLDALNLGKEMNAIIKDFDSAIEEFSQNEEDQNAASRVDDEIFKIINFLKADAKVIADNNTDLAKKTTLVMIVFSAGAFFLSLGLGLLISRIIGKPLRKLEDAAKKMAKGETDIEVESKAKDEVGKLTRSFGKMIDNVRSQAEAAQKIAAGDLTVEITPRSENDILAICLKQVVETLRNLLTETSILTESAIAGNLEVRGDADKFEGGYKDLIVGFNDTLTTIISPLKMASEYMENISKGEIPAEITDEYNGDFNQIKNSINTCINAINSLIEDANMLAISAIEGDLDMRADASKHGGDFAKIVDGFNNTLDSIIAPIKEATTVLEEMSNGNLQVRVEGDYKGDHALIKNALNTTIEALSSYVSEISLVLSEMANSNFDVGINNEYTGDFVQMKDALNLIISTLSNVLGEINNAADQVASGSRQVSDGSQALSQGATEQASSIEELTASITEIASQTKVNAINANQANELALLAKQNAEKGNVHMNQMLDSMESINEASNNISKIIKVIDEIAFQTNILALNAAVEAAHAGQHGKGFAVVAEEVRNLAARSANAAKETTNMIEGSIKKAEEGTKIANQTAAALDKIVEGVSKAVDLVGEIAIASNDQATAIAQIDKGLTQVAHVVQTNSATAEESAAASEELSGQAELLKQMVGNFKLKVESDNIEETTDNSDDHMDEISIFNLLESSDQSSKDFIKDSAKDVKSSDSAKPAKQVKPLRIELNDKDFGKY